MRPAVYETVPHTENVTLGQQGATGDTSKASEVEDHVTCPHH